MDKGADNTAASQPKSKRRRFPCIEGYKGEIGPDKTPRDGLAKRAMT